MSDAAAARVPAGEPSRHPGPAARHRWVTLAVLCVSLLVVSLDTTILNVALPVIVRDMQATSSQLQWIVDAYAVVFAGLLLTFGSLGDRIGRRTVFAAGLIVFAAGSAASAFAGTPDRLVLTRGLMGLGAAAIMPATLSILTNVFTDARERAEAIGIWSATTGVGVAVGPIAGGWLLAHYWWGSVFLVNVPIAALGLVAALLLVPNSRDRAPRAADPVGAVLSVVGVGILLWGVIDAPNRTWSSPLVVGALAAGASVLGGFVLWERRSPHPMLDLGFFRTRRFSVAVAAMAVVTLGLLGALFVLTQYLQFSLGYSALDTGLRVAPIAAVLLVVAPASTRIVRRVGTKPVLGAGMASITLGLAMLSRTTVTGTYRDALPAFFLLGIGVGLSFAPATDAIMGTLPIDRAGVGAATNNASVQLGGALGVGILGSVLATRYQDHLAPLLAGRHLPGHVSNLITGSLGGALAVAGHVPGAVGSALAAAARDAFVSGMDLAMLVGAVVVGAATVAVVLALPNRPEQPEQPEPGDPGRRRRQADGTGRPDIPPR